MRRIAFVVAGVLLAGVWPGAAGARQNPAPQKPAEAGAQSQGAAAAAPATTPPAKPAAAVAPAAREIFERYAQAIGGHEAWQKLTSRVTRGTIRIEGIDGTGTTLQYERAPNQNLAIATLADGTVFREGFDGKASWEQDPNGTVKVTEGARGADARAEADFYFEVELAKIYPHARTMGQRTADGRLAIVVEASAPGGTLHWLYFDAETWLRFRTDIFENPLSPSPTTVERYDDYKDVDGVKYPFKGSLRGEGTNIATRLTVIHHNVTVTDDEVARPVSAN
ncbi:MAG TPA: hypothetical protein VKG84_10760 [Candidatus Acidoferrales bacterium]|nr:hypothetical protein [Candidatus Acidoferrales bacterium]